MGKPIFDADGMGAALPEQRRRIRRVRMIVDLTSALIGRDTSMTYREARSLVECAEKAVLELLPDYDAIFESYIRPTFDRIMRERWPMETPMQPPPISTGRELVN